VRDNIAYGRAGATEQEIIEAAKLATPTTSQ
jgi:ABC-type multidrug transport system fused ATPase/permease subunit